MLTILGYAVVIFSILVGYLAHGGSLAVLWQPTEFLIIGGAALGSFIVAGTRYSLGQVLKNLPRLLAPRTPTKHTYMQIISLLYVLFGKMHREGIISIEKDIENPSSSALFTNFPQIYA